MVSACLKITLLCLFYCSALGENFDRQASLRRSLIYTDTLVRRPKKVKRRKTITGVPDNIQKELGMARRLHSVTLLAAAWHYSANLVWLLVKSIYSDSQILSWRGARCNSYLPCRWFTAGKSVCANFSGMIEIELAKVSRHLEHWFFPWLHWWFT